MNIENKNLLKSINNIHKYTICTKLRTFQYKLALLAITTNVDLCRYKIRDNDTCTFCNNAKENLMHLFCKCPVVHPLWYYITEITQIPLDSRKILLNEIVSNPYLKENCLVLLTKYYIYRNCCLKEPITVSGLKRYVLNYVQLEKLIAENKNKISQHKLEWKDFNL